jgi:hypothetical protein
MNGFFLNFYLFIYSHILVVLGVHCGIYKSSYNIMQQGGGTKKETSLCSGNVARRKAWHSREIKHKDLNLKVM